MWGGTERGLPGSPIGQDSTQLLLLPGIRDGDGDVPQHLAEGRQDHVSPEEPYQAVQKLLEVSTQWVSGPAVCGVSVRWGKSLRC